MTQSTTPIQPSVPLYSVTLLNESTTTVQAIVPARPTIPMGAKILAVLLMGGGLFGAGLCLFALPSFLLMSRFFLGLFFILFAAIFLWSAFVGFRLWRNESGAWKWATLLFATQIPILSNSALAYEFFTGLSIKILYGSGMARFGFNAGAGFEVNIGSAVESVTFGVNVFAICAVLYLIFKKPTTHAS